jgi:hypothetical protein
VVGNAEYVVLGKCWKIPRDSLNDDLDYKTVGLNKVRGRELIPIMTRRISYAVQSYDLKDNKHGEDVLHLPHVGVSTSICK